MKKSINPPLKNTYILRFYLQMLQVWLTHLNTSLLKWLSQWDGRKESGESHFIKQTSRLWYSSWGCRVLASGRARALHFIRSPQTEWRIRSFDTVLWESSGSSTGIVVEYLVLFWFLRFKGLTSRGLAKCRTSDYKGQQYTTNRSPPDWVEPATCETFQSRSTTTVRRPASIT